MKYRMSRSSKIAWWVMLPVMVGIVVGFITWMQHTIGTSGERPHTTLLMNLFIGGVVVILWAVLFGATAIQERRQAEWKAGAQARREAAIRAQAAKMAEVNKLVDQYGMDIGIIAYMLNEDPAEVERVMG